MPYFERVKKLSAILFVVGGLFLLIFIIQFFRGDGYYSFNYDVKNATFTVVYFIVSLFSFTLAIALRYIANDTREYIERIQRFNEAP